jgi:hypothetical protein
MLEKLIHGILSLPPLSQRGLVFLTQSGEFSDHYWSAVNPRLIRELPLHDEKFGAQ